MQAKVELAVVDVVADIRQQLEDIGQACQDVARFRGKVSCTAHVSLTGCLSMIEFAHGCIATCNCSMHACACLHGALMCAAREVLA
jgi:hypothetical protein